MISTAWSGTSAHVGAKLCRKIVWRECEEQRGHEVVRRSSRWSKVTDPLATRWSWLLVVIPGNQSYPRSTVIAVVSVVLAEQVLIIQGRQWRSSIAEDCLRHSGASSRDLGGRRRATRSLDTRFASRRARKAPVRLGAIHPQCVERSLPKSASLLKAECRSDQRWVFVPPLLPVIARANPGRPVFRDE